MNNAHKLLDKHFKSSDNTKKQLDEEVEDRAYDYPMGTVVRCGQSWQDSDRFVFMGETEFKGQKCPVLMKKKSIANSMDSNPDTFIAEPGTEIKWASDDPPNAYIKRLVQWAEGKDKKYAKYSFPSGDRVDTPFDMAPQKRVQSVSPGDVIDYDGDEYLYCGKHKNQWVVAADDESNQGASVSKEELNSREYTVDIVDPMDVHIKRHRFKPDIAHQIHQRTVNSPRFGRRVKLRYDDYDEDTYGRWMGNYDEYDSMVAVRSKDKKDPNNRMRVQNRLNHPDDNEQFDMIRIEDDRVKMDNELPSPNEVQYFRKMVKIPPNKRDKYAGRFKRAYMQSK